MLKKKKKKKEIKRQAKSKLVSLLAKKLVLPPEEACRQVNELYRWLINRRRYVRITDMARAAGISTAAISLFLLHNQIGPRVFKSLWQLMEADQSRHQNVSEQDMSDQDIPD